ncbi:MAG: TerC family protein [Sterolibacterium sp.]|nr:TerC family protein [Sterolibacterium sp.]
MNALYSHASPSLWGGFILFVLFMLALDLFVFGGRRVHRVSVREAATWSLVWVMLALAFAGFLWLYFNDLYGAQLAHDKTLDFLAGYLIEKSLSVDNIFVFLMIFSAFQVPAEYQRRVLLYGVLGAIVLRTAMILAGAWVVSEFSWVLYLFGVFLVITGLRMLVMSEKEPDLEKNPILRLARRHLRITTDTRDANGEEHGERFSVVRDGVRYFTPLFLVLILVEASDVVFAIDSIPAIFAITTDPFIVFTSNIFAIMGLRALYFLLVDMADRFHLLKYGLALVLTFIGTKMLVAPWHHIPTATSLLVVTLILSTSIGASLIGTRRR